MQRTAGSHGRVVAHILDPITGYSNRELQVGKDIDVETVRRLGRDGNVFVVVAYEGGAPSATICSPARWLRAQAQQEAVDVVDPSVWRKRAELEIS